MYLQCDAKYHIQGVYNIPQRLAHLASVGVPDHGVKVDLREGQLAQELLPKEHHPGHPEEQDVMTSLQKLVGIEDIQVLSLQLESRQ